jgi:uncharacterized protein
LIAGSPTSHLPGRPAKRVTVLLNTRDHTHHRSLMIDLLKAARRRKLAGATVFQARQGFGTGGRTHRVQLLSDDSPRAVVLVDQADKIDEFLSESDSLLDGTFVMVEDVEIVDL